MTIMTNETTGQTYRDIEVWPIPYSNCVVGQNIFYENAAEIEQYGIEQYLCPDWTNLTLQGNFYSPVHRRVELIFQRCQPAPGKKCANDTQFFAWINKLTMI